MTDISKAIRVALAMKNVNQKELAKRISVSYPTVTRIVNRPHLVRVAQVQKIAEVLDMDLITLLMLGQ